MTEELKNKKCPKCNCWRFDNDFIGNNRLLKTCDKCRERGRIERKKYCEVNQEKIIQYRQDNKEKIKEYKQQYNQENRDKAKTYREENKEHITEMKQKYFEENKEKIYTKKLEEVPCECGCNISRVHLSRHRKSPKHINMMKLMEQDTN
jgi:hypothetical protein